MHKHIVLLQYRGGSSYFQGIISDNYVDNSYIDDLVSNGLSLAGFLTTKQRYTCPFEADFLCDVDKFLEKSSFNSISRRVWLGDWWGQCSADKVPGPYDINTPTSWSADFIGKYIENGWKFLAIVRNGANQVESTRNYHGKLEASRNQNDSYDYFGFLIKSWRNKARVIIDSASAYPEAYKIVRYEDILSNPRNTLSYIDSYLDIGLNLRRCLYRTYEKRRLAKEFGNLRHSSFTNSEFNSRWRNWSFDDLQYFKSVCSQEMKDLGYEI